jgi:septum formation inhibitor MinC
MVAKKHISNFVNSYLGHGETSKILDDALSEIQKTLPNATKGQLIDAYLHENEFKQPSKSDLQKSLDEARRSLVRTAKKEREQNLTTDQAQKELLTKEKENAQQAIKEFERKLRDGEFEDEPKPKTLNKYDAELIRLNKKRAEAEHGFRVQQNEIKAKNTHAATKLAEAARGLMVTAMIGNPIVWGKVVASTILRPVSESVSKLTFGKAFEKVFPGISDAAARGGESSSIRSVQKGFEAYFRQNGAKGIEAMGKKAQEKYIKAQEALNNYTGTDKDKLKSLQGGRDNAYLGAASNVIYQYIGGSSVKDAWDALKHRSNQIEEQFGAVDREGLKGKGLEMVKGWNALDNLSYVTNFVGRSHSAIKTFSGRYFFASAFMARLEQGLKDGVDLGNPDRLMEMAHESYLNWDMGKLQQGNYVSDAWNYMVRQVESPKPLLKKNPGYEKYGKVAGIVLRSDVAISRIPNNIAVEAFDYTVGAFRGMTNAIREYNKATKQAKNDYGHLTGSDEFKDRVSEIMSNMDPKRAASIARSFRRGGLGLGLYALAGLYIGTQFGAFKHQGQPKKKDPDDLGEDELNPGQIMFGDDKLGQGMSDMISETPALFPLLMGTGMSYIYKNSIEKDKTSQQAAEKSFMTHLLIMQERSPQVNLFQPIQLGKTFGKAFSDRYDQASGLIYGDQETSK